MQKLAEICVRRPVFASVLILILVVVGMAGYFQLGVDRYPNVDFANVNITTTQPGASPQTVESEITDKIEEAINTVSGIDEVRSSSFEGVSIVNVQFVLEKDGDVAAQEVRDRVNRILGQLPEDIDPPIIEKMDSASFPILSIALSRTTKDKQTPRKLRDLTEYADKTLRRRLESLSGVGRVDVLGGTQRQINIWLDAYALRAYDLTVTDVTRALKAQNVEVPGGRLDGDKTELTLRTEGRITRIEDFAKIRIKATGRAGIVRLSDVARVEDGAADPSTLAEVNGQPTVTLLISKQSGANTVALVHAVKERLKELDSGIKDKGYSYRLVNDQSEYIEASIHSVQEHLIVGSILAVAVVLIFLLNWRSAFIAGIAVPASLISTFGLIWVMGFTLNTLTLLALTLAVGIVIDDAIVVLENIYRLIEEKDRPPFEAAIEGTREIGLAVLATTLSLIAVFLPVAFMKGIVGRFMNSFGITMAFAIFVSLIVAFALTPTMSARMLHSTHEPGARRDSPWSQLSARFSAPIYWFLGKMDDIYLAILGWAMKHRWVVVLAVIGVLVSTPFIGSHLSGGFLPKNDESQLQIVIRAPEGTSLSETGRIARGIAEKMRSRPEVVYTLATIGGGGGGGGAEDVARNKASIYVKLKPVEERATSQDDLIVYARDEVLPSYKKRYLLRTNVGPYSEWGGQGDVQFAVTGPDLEILEDLSTRLLKKLETTKDVADVDSTLIAGRPELSAQVDRDMAAVLGVQPADVAGALNALVGENEVSRYEERGEQYEVHVRAEQQYRVNKQGLELLTVSATPPEPDAESASTSISTATSVPLEQLVKFVPHTGPSSIRRLNRQRQATLSAYLIPGGDAGKVSTQLAADFEEVKKQMKLGSEYRTLAVGDSKEQAKAFMAFLVAFALSLVFMYLILAAQFESWLHPITILLSLPLTVPFALLSLLLFNQGINIFSLLGILVLFGVVKKNAILQIDHTIQLRERGMPRNEAVLQANRDRLRPILMTTLAFVAGMLPLLISSGVGSGDNKAIASVIFGGQTFSLLLTLLATPVAYTLFDDLSTWLRNVRGRIFGGGRRVERDS